jgi:hypothetical protein
MAVPWPDGARRYVPGAQGLPAFADDSFCEIRLRHPVAED